MNMSQRDYSENEPEGTPDLPAANRALFIEKVRQSNAACQNGDYSTAVTLYTDALALDPANHLLYSNRSAARLKQGQFSLALQDATKARELCPQWPKGYFRQGVALQCLGRYGEALASFSSGLAQDSTNKQLLAGLVEASIKSPLRHALEPTLQQLRAMKLDQSPFVVISVVGQELLQAGQYQSAVIVLEAALRIGSCSLKLRGSVFSALSSAHWALNQLDKAIGYMQQDLAVAKSLGDTAGECRAHGNLGSAYFSQGSFKEALTSHRYQLVLAMKCKDTQAAAAALTSLGHVYTAIGDYPNALASHKQCVQLVKQMGDRLQEAREIGNVGAVYLAMGEFDSAVDCHTQHLRLARKLNNQVEEARAYSNLGSSHHYRRSFTQAITYHEQVLRIAQQLGDRAIEARAYAGLGHAARCACDFVQAKRWHEKQLEMALAARDKVGEGRACSNLGIVYQLLGEHDAALKLHQAHLTIARLLQDRAGMGRAYGNIGNAYSAAGLYEAAIKYHKQELIISKEVHDRSAEASTHGNLAVAYQALGAHDMALMHYRAHLNIARELKDTAGEACALLNLGNCLSSRQEFAQAVPHYEQYLMLSQELGDVVAEGKACHFLGYAHYCIGNYREAVRYYDQDLALAKDLQDKMNMGRAYCNLGLAHLALSNSGAALECQKYFLAIAHMTNHLPGKFRAFGNIGDVLIRTGDIEEAARMYQRQLALARQARERPMEAAACGALGLAHRLIKKLDKALGYHTQELTLRQEMLDLLGECRAHGHLGAVHMALGNYTHAVKCYQEQLERAQELQDSAIEAQAYGNLGIARLNMGHYEDAIGFLEQQLGTLEQVNLSTVQHDRARALGHLGDCYDALGDYEEGIKCHERHLQLATALQSYRDQERAYRGLGHSHRSLGNLQEALVCLEKRLVVAHELGSFEAKAAAYGDLGNIHSALANHEQAVNCLEHQRDIARDLGDRVATSDASSSLGNVFLQMGDLDGALKLHEIDLELCESIGMLSLQARACGNLGSVFESLRNYGEAIRFFEKQLALTTDRLTKTFACGALGRVFHTMGQIPQAINFLRQGLALAQTLNKSEEEAKIRHRLGLVLRASGDNENARSQLEMAAQILESLRYDQRSPEARTLLFDLQTACYHTLQKTLVAMGRNEEALVAAERCKARITLDSLHGQLLNGTTSHSNRKTMVTCSESIFDIVNKSKTNVIYFSLVGDELYAWFLQPQKRIVRFHVAKLNEFPLIPSSTTNNSININKNSKIINTLTNNNNNNSMIVPQNGNSSNDSSSNCNANEESSCSILEQYIKMVRDSLGVNSENVLQEGDGSGWRSSDNLLDDYANDRPGFLRMGNRGHKYNSSNYSLSSLFSLGSVGGSVASLQGSTRSIGSLQGSTRSRRAPVIPPWQGPSSLHALYNLLLAPFDDLLPSSAITARLGHKELILVLESELYLVPFAVLRSGQENGEYLSERCSLLTVPSLQTLRQKSRIKSSRDVQENLNSALVIGGPRIPTALSEAWGWSESPASLQEAAMVSDMLHAKVLVSTNATKETVIAELPAAECVHFAANLSWKLGAVVLSPGDMIEPQSQKRFYPNDMCDNDEENGDSIATNMEIPPLSDFILSAADVLSLKLNAKLIVLSSYHSIEPISGSGIANLAGSWLCAGAGAVLISLWPVPETAAKILLRAFYSALLQGARATRALAEAMQTVQHTKHFAHPANWAGFLLIGGNVRLSNKVALIGQALCELMRTPEKCRDALRVCLHLVEKSLQRIHRGQKNAMYTTQKSIDNKAGSVSGWKDLLMAVGFRFEPAANGIPSSVFFPQTDPEDRLSQCSASLQALLALSPTTLHALSKLVNSPEIADDIIGVMRNVIAQFPPKGSPNDIDTVIEIPLSVRLWRIAGCHELLASLGFDLTEVGQDQVILRTGKQANRRNSQFVLQALLALFDTQEAPRSLGLDSSSSTESLNDDGHSVENLQTVNRSSSPQNSGPQRSVSPVGTVKSLNISVRPPPLPSVRRIPLLSGSSAFISYVRRRGEPDGGRTDTEPSMNMPSHQMMTTTNNDGTISSTMLNNLDSSLANTTDSDLSDCYASQQTLNNLIKGIDGNNHNNKQPRMGYASLRGPVKVGRPGGGGESDAAFTPSPPITIQSIDNNVSLALAHQTRIRNLYSSTVAANQTVCSFPPHPDHQLHPNDMQMHTNRRPDSSSSASSTTDWEGSGHATVLRRAHQQQQQQPQILPPLPPPRQNLPLVDSLRPLVTLTAPVYNNLALPNNNNNAVAGSTSINTNVNAAVGGGGASAGAGIDSTSSDSDFERNFDIPTSTLPTTTSNGIVTQLNSLKMGRKLKPLQQQFLSRKITDQFMDRLSVRTELSNNNNNNIVRKQLAMQLMPSHNETINENTTIPTTTTTDQTELKTYDELNSSSSVNISTLPLIETITNNGIQSAVAASSTTAVTSALASAVNIPPSASSSTSKENKLNGPASSSHNKNIQDSILRHMNREMTPTISEVYHERNLGLGLAPPLSKLLLSKNYEENDSNVNTTVADVELNINNLNINNGNHSNTNNNNNNNNNNNIATGSNYGISTINEHCTICNSPAENQCQCKHIPNHNPNSSGTTTVKKTHSKPWLSNVTPNIVKASDLTTADILERQNKYKNNDKQSNNAMTAGGGGPITSGTTSMMITQLLAKQQQQQQHNHHQQQPQHNHQQSHQLQQRSNSPFSELSRRDDGDGRSVADSQCSSSYKIDLNNANNIISGGHQNQKHIQSNNQQQQQQQQPQQSQQPPNSQHQLRNNKFQLNGT